MDASTSAGAPPALSGIAEAQRAFFRTGATRPIEFRRRQLLALRAAVAEREARILEALQQDLGRPAAEAYTTEPGFVLAEIDHTLKHLARWARPKRVGTPLLLFPGTSWIYPEPYGVALVVSPWNYPLQLALVPLLGAIAAGNCAVVKPSELSPAVSALVAEIITATFPPDYVAVVQGGPEAVEQLLAQRFDTIFFTGSTRIGRIVMAAAARHLTPVTLELGGKNPCIVDASADLPLAARRIAWGKFMNAGQTCVAPDYVLAHASIKDALLRELAAALRGFYGDEPAASPDYGRIVNARHLERLAGLLQGARVAVGGQVDAGQRYIAPTLLDGARWDDAVMQDEIFGPVLPVIAYEDLEATLADLEQRPKPLALYVFSSDAATQERVLQRLSSGGACVNDTVGHLVNAGLPFGGVGDSGIGGYHGQASFDTFSHRKSVVKRGTWLDPALKYPPYRTPLKWLRHAMKYLT